MSTAASDRKPVLARRPPAAASDWLRSVAAAILLVGSSRWLARGQLRRGARAVRPVSLIGLTNGAIYALVALGYTLVYGIIELINFAHGDMFMLGRSRCISVTDGSFELARLRHDASPLGTVRDDSPLAIARSRSSFLTMAFCATINVTIERIALQAAPQPPQLAPLITAIGFSFILQNIGLAWKGPGQCRIPDVLPAGNVFEIGGVAYSLAVVHRAR